MLEPAVRIAPVKPEALPFRKRTPEPDFSRVPVPVIVPPAKLKPPTPAVFTPPKLVMVVPSVPPTLRLPEIVKVPFTLLMRLLRMVAHELRTPLTAAKLALQSHNLGQIDESRFRDVLGRRLDDIEELSRDLLEVGTTRWEALFNPQRLALGQVAAEAILELEKLWIGRDLELVTDIPADLPDVYADQRRMRQVLLNLLENALKFTPEGGRVSLTLLHRTSQWLQVSVCDSGPGIPREEQQRIFQDRVRLPQTSGTTSGFGVGLSVCRRIAEVHGGRIWVVSDPGEGACFHFTVPVWTGQIPSDGGSPSGREPPHLP